MTAIAMGDIPAHHAARKGDGALALVYPEATLSWKQLDERANRYARRLRAVGVQKNDFVAIALPNGVDLHIVAFGCWKVGATPVPIAPKMPLSEADAVLQAMAPRVLVADTGPARSGIITLSSDSSAATGVDGAPVVAIVGAHWKAACSGGSTGVPKVIVIDAPARFDPRSAVASDVHKMRLDGVVLNCGPLYHNGPFLFAHTALFTGSALIGMERFDAEAALRLIERHQVNWASFVPAMMHRISALPQSVRSAYDLSSLETVWHMAAPCPPWLKEEWIGWLGAARIWERYGGTEGFGSTVIRGDDWLAKRGSVGRMLGETKLKIAADDGSTCPPGQVGEIRFLPPGGRAPSFYLGIEAPRDAEGYLTLGDMGHVDADGYLYIADRRTDLILRGGVNIYPAEVEAALSAHPDVAAAVVIGLPCDELGARVHAIIEPRTDRTIDLAPLTGFLSARLIKTKLPETYELANEPLRDEAGKVRRSALRAERIEWARKGRDFRISANGTGSPGAATSPGRRRELSQKADDCSIDANNGAAHSATRHDH